MAAFPPCCTRIGVSTVPNLAIELRGAPSPAFCLWFIGRRSIVRFAARTLGDDVLSAYTIDGARVRDSLQQGTLELEFRSNLLAIWQAASNESVLAVQALQVDKIASYPSNIRHAFDVSADPEYFYAKPEPVRQ